jgi:hypothetical protein
VVVVGSGFWRWRFRGGSSADAFAAFWGGIFDWLAGERADRRAAIPDASFFRAGDAIRWRRGGPGDSLVVVAIRRRNDSSAVDSLTLSFPAGATVLESPPMPAGIYDVTARGGSSILAINASSEWIQRPVRVESGAIRGGAPLGLEPRLRDHRWLYVLIVVALCAEWLMRRRMGMR